MKNKMMFVFGWMHLLIYSSFSNNFGVHLYEINNVATGNIIFNW